jgi:hypothetical protein
MFTVVPFVYTLPLLVALSANLFVTVQASVKFFTGDEVIRKNVDRLIMMKKRRSMFNLIMVTLEILAFDL